MKSFTLDWKGWWLLRSPMSNVPELSARTAVFAVIGARLKKVGSGVGSTAREVVLFGSYQGDEPVRRYLEKVQKMSLGVFAINRCKDIRKYPLVYVAEVKDADEADLEAIRALLYEAVPFAPRHAAMPAPYQGEPFNIVNGGRNPGLPEEIFRGSKSVPDDAGATVVPEADAAMADAIAKEVAATRRMTPDEAQVSGIATERVGKPSAHFTTEKVEKPPRLIDTAKVDQADMPRGMATERVDKPSATGDDNTEFVPKPEDSQLADQSDEIDGPTVLDEAEQEAS